MGKLSVAKFISSELRLSGKSRADLSREIGIKNANFLSMIVTGKTKLPLNRVPALANALGIEPRALFLHCLEEYDPELLQTIKDCLPGAFLTEEELDVMRVVKAKIGVFPARGLLRKDYPELFS